MICLSTNIPELQIYRRGKVRDVYSIEDKLLIIATDRISAFDVVLPNGIPHKGIVLNQLTKFWFDKLRDSVENHLISTEINDFPAALQKHKEALAGRTMLVKRAQAFPVECVVRGYLSGSGWKEYSATGSVCGIALRPGLCESGKLDDPIFTPATKEKSGHDINISMDQMAKVMGQERAEQLRDLSLALYKQASEHAGERGIIIADTKFEFGEHEGKIILIDEALTPDSSRFWPRALYQPGRLQPSFDKQFVRDYLESICWNKQPPAPSLPSRVVSITSQKYLEAYRLLTGKELIESLKN